MRILFLTTVLIICSMNTAFMQVDPYTYEADRNKWVEMEIKNLATYSQETYVVDLTKKGGKENWVLPVVIGDCETKAIVRTIENINSTRPLTYDLILDIIEKLNAAVEHVVITKLVDGTFYAIISLKKADGGSIEIDARPSDSINIALKNKKPIYATQTVIDQAKEVRKQ